MKQIVKMTGVAFAMVLGLLAFASCSDDDKKISYSELPANAKAIIELYFPGQTSVYTEKSKDDGTTNYDVTLNNGTEIEFDKSGNWIYVDCKYTKLPTGILPDKIADYITEKYPTASAYKVDKEYGGYQVNINNGLKLIFSADEIGKAHV